MACWIFTGADTGTRSMFCAFDTIPDAPYSKLQYGANGTITATIFQTATTYLARQTNTSVLPDNTLSHVGFSWSGGTTGAAILIYYNGVESALGDLSVGSFTAPYSGSDVSGYIGAEGSGAGVDKVPTAAISEVGMWDVELSAAEFGALAHGYSPALIRPSGLIHYWPLLRDNVNYMGAAPVITGTTVSVHPRVIMSSPAMRGTITTLAAPPFNVAGMMQGTYFTQRSPMIGY